MLAKRLIKAVRNSKFFDSSIEGGEISYADEFIYWPNISDSLQAGDQPEALYHASRVKFLVVDDVGANRDNTGYVTGRLGNLLGERAGKWTVVTSNLTMEQISERLDTRIASRLVRGNNRVVEIDCIDYALRKL